MPRRAMPTIPRLIASVIAACVTYQPTSLPAQALPSSLEQREGFLEAGGAVRLFYRVLGAPRRDTIVVLHGGPGFSSAYIADDFAPFAARYTLIFYDQRGAGRSTLVSDSAALSGERFVDDLEAVRQHFALRRATLLGHSWGAGVAAMYAIRYPERVERLLLVGPMSPMRSGLAQVFAAINAGRDSAGRHRLREVRTAWYADTGSAVRCRAFQAEWFRPFVPEPAVLLRTRGDFCAGTPDALRNAEGRVGRFTMASLGDWDWRPALTVVSARTLVLQGSADVFPPESAREWAAALPDARVLLLDEVGHFPYLEAPDRFGAALDAFMAGRWPAGAVVGKQ